MEKNQFPERNIKDKTIEHKMTTIERLMWNCQHIYHSTVESYAKELFEKLSSELVPNVFILGISREDSNSHPICIEPKKSGISVDVFEKVERLAKERYEEYYRKYIPHIKPSYSDKNYHDSLKEEFLVQTVGNIVDKEFKNKVSFVSDLVRVNKYNVLSILQLDKSAYDEINILKQKEVKIAEKHVIPVYRSLIEPAIPIFLSEIIKLLYEPNQDSKGHYFFDKDLNDILRNAAHKFIGSVSNAVTGGQSGGDSSFNHAYSLFKVANDISSLKYEGDSSDGMLVIAKGGHPNIDLKIRLDTPIPFGDTRYTRSLRKLLQISSKDLFLYTTGPFIVGFGKFKGEYNPAKEDLFKVIFSGQLKWRFEHDKNVLMTVDYGNPSLPRPKLDKSEFYSTLRRVFEIDDFTIKNHWEIVKDAIKQKKGTLIIISKDAEKESERLENTGFRISPPVDPKETIKSITSIDGGLLLDKDGLCHSIGVTLDGEAVDKENRSRGSRYNSAVRYVERNKDKAIAIIASEDGMVQLYPDYATNK